jgi:Zn-dependent protease/predicted transcriptional regulator
MGGLRIGKVFGIPIYLHASWFIVFALLTFSLTTQFGAEFPGRSRAWQLGAGVVTALLFFGSVIFHELGHSLVAKAYRIPVASITLFVFGGVARIRRDPPTARQEFYVAVAGPVASFALAGAFHLAGGGPVFTWLARTNFMLAAFNLIPGFPLDGGRILRAIVWGLSGSYARATAWATRGGRLFAFGLIGYGVWEGFHGNPVSGIWLPLLGWFLLSTQQSYEQAAHLQGLKGLRASDVMNHEAPQIGRHLSLEDYLQEMLRTGQRFHLVMAGDDLVGGINPQALRGVPKDEWISTSVQAVMIPRDQLHTARPDDLLLRVLERMQNLDIAQMPVLDHGRIAGLITRESILRVLQTRQEIAPLTE